MNITPFMRTPFTDIFATLSPLQDHPFCSKHEMRLVDCMEAYGALRGTEKCKLLIEDFRECIVRSKQNARVEIMRTERKRQFDAGERKVEHAPDIAPNSY